MSANDYRVVEIVDRRALAAIRLIDGGSGLPLVRPAKVELVAVAIVDRVPAGPPTVVEELTPLPRSVKVRQNRRGWFVILRAPDFDSYTTSFGSAVPPATIVAPRGLRLRFSVTEVGPNHLPQLCDVVIPRALDPEADDSVFAPRDVPLMLAPNAPVQSNSAVLRASIREQTSGIPLGGVLVRVVLHPSAPGARVVGEGLTEWRSDSARGEAVVRLMGLPRFAPGAGANVFETTHPIGLEVVRDRRFPDPSSRLRPAEQLPNPELLRPAAGSHIVRRFSPPATPALEQSPVGPLTIAAGEELAVAVAMP